MEEPQPPKFRISNDGYKSLFYPLTGVFMDIDGQGMIRVDGRGRSLNDAFADPDFESQMNLLSPNDTEKHGLTTFCTRLYQQLSPFSLGGHSKIGFLGHFKFPSRFPSRHRDSGDLNLSMCASVQVLFYHPAAKWAAEFDPGINWGDYRLDRSASFRVERMAREEGVSGLASVRVLMAGDKKWLVCKCAVLNMYTELNMQIVGSAGNPTNVLEMHTVKAIAHLHRQLVCYRSPEGPSPLVAAPAVLAPDPGMCAYCADEGFTRMYCAKCQVSWYCSKQCQTKHWKMKGPFSHRRECKLMRDPSVTKPAIPVGRLVMIHGLNSAAGQSMDGKDAIVVTPPTEQKRLGVVLVDDVSKDQQERLKRGDVGWVPTKLQKAIKFENLELVWTPSKV